MNLKTTWVPLLGAALIFVWICGSAEAQTPAAPRPQHAILLVIDGFSHLAPERVDMPTLKALMARGSYFRESYSVVPSTPNELTYKAINATFTSPFRRAATSSRENTSRARLKQQAANGENSFTEADDNVPHWTNWYSGQADRT